MVPRRFRLVRVLNKRPDMTTTKTTRTNKLFSSSHVRAALMGLALAITAVGCGAPDPGDVEVGADAVSCAAAKAWVDGIQYNVGDIVTFGGATFKCIQA